MDFLVARYGEFILLKPRLQRADGAALGRAGRAADRGWSRGVRRDAKTEGRPGNPDVTYREETVELDRILSDRRN